MRLYTGPRWPNGYCSELTLPDDWVSKDDDDGERRFVSHVSPAGSRLVLKESSGVRVDYRSRWIPKDEQDPQVRLAYILADEMECITPAAGSVSRWLFRSALRALGRKPKLEAEQLGACRGFTFRIRSGERAGWYGVFAQSPWIVWVRFRAVCADQEGEIALARSVVGSLRFVPVSEARS